MTLSVCIITLNEEANLPRTLESVRWADEIVVVDSGSTDRTVEIARCFGARVLTHDFGGHGEQKNVALRQATCEWTLLLDADEVVSQALAAEMQQLLAAKPRFDAYWVPRRNFIFGRAMRHGGFYPDRKLRLCKRDVAPLAENAGPHSTPQFTGPTGKLKQDLLHYAYPNLRLYLEHMNRYSSDPQILQFKPSSWSGFAFVWNVVLNPLATFFYNYFLRLGFLDGREGLLLHLYHSAYVSWKYAKAWERGRAVAPATSR